MQAWLARKRPSGVFGGTTVRRILNVSVTTSRERRTRAIKPHGVKVMASLSGSMSATRPSPNERMQQMLQSAVSAGTVKPADQSALSSALDGIDRALKSGASASGMEPGGMKTKVDGLIDQEVSSGKLTDDQATELKQVFAEAAQKMGGAHHHHGGPKGPPPSDDASTDTSDTTTTSADSAKNAIDTLIGFLKKMEDTMSSSTNYTSSGTSSGSGLSSLLVDSNA